MSTNGNKTAEETPVLATTTAASNSSTTTVTAALSPPPPPAAHLDPLLRERSNTVRRGDYVLLNFADGRQFFVQCVDRTVASKTKHGVLKYNKRSYPSHNLIGLPYGTILEMGAHKKLEVLDHSEGLLPTVPSSTTAAAAPMIANQEDHIDDSTFPTVPVPPQQEQERDNRHLVDDNTSQGLDFETLLQMRNDGKAGHEIVQSIIENSATFQGKTDFSKAKYIARKQIKYQPRCRLTRCNAATICEALFLKDAKRVMNLRHDSLAQILAYSNLYAGSRVLVFETIQGLVTGAVAERMGGYGQVFSIYTGQQPAFLELIDRFNLSFGETSSIKWVHCGDVFVAEEDNDDGSSSKNVSNNDANAEENSNGDNNNNKSVDYGTRPIVSASTTAAAQEEEEEDTEATDRNLLQWPCPLQDHTRAYLLGPDFKSDKKRRDFMKKRCARFARKLTRHSPTEAAQWLQAGKCDSVIIATRYDPTETLLGLLPHLAPSCPFVVFCEFMEPLTVCFKELQNQELAINIRLSDTWMREWQVLPGRTHPNMNMSQSGGFILTGIKLDEQYGRDHLDDALLKEIRLEMGPRRGKKKKIDNDVNQGDDNKNKKSRKANSSSAMLLTSSLPLPEPEPKRSRTEEKSEEFSNY
jgi:tRNA (adenine58-N1)-methyltransferase non-catalytic subunit